MTDFPPSTNSTDACARFEAHLAAYLERELDLRAQQVMQQHRATCTACDTLVRELESLTTAAATLRELAPARDLWSGIAARIETPVAALPVRPLASAPPIRTRNISVRWFAVAATVLVAVSSAITWRVARTNRAAETVATTTDSAERSASTRATIVPVMNADVVYEEQILALRTIVDQRFRELDSTTVSELQRNLAIIDKAIADSKAALAKDPNSAVVSGSLDRALANKVALMRRVALL